MALDPILLEVLRNRLDAIADEMELTLLKSAASPIVKEGLDASAALFNTQGETIAQAAAIPIHLGALQFAAQRLVRAFAPEHMQDGDAFLLNHPYDGGTHLPDITLAVPVLADGRGAPGARAHAHVVRADGTHEELPSKKMIVLHPGDQLWEYIAGGAGYGDPLDRDPAAVLADLLDGKITAAGATMEYGVVFTPDGAAVDEVKTKESRAALRRTSS